MRILFVHQNFPGQFVHLSAHLAAQGHDVVALGFHDPGEKAPPGVRFFRYALSQGNGKNLHPWAVDFESKIIRAESCANSARTLRNQGFIPDLMVVHPAWGDSWFLRELWPQARMIGYFEFFYKAKGHDTDFDPEFPGDERLNMRLRVRNASHLVGLEMCDAGITPTHWQHMTHPKEFRSKLHVIHDGIDTEVFKPDPNASVTLASGMTFRRGDEVITFCARTLEPLRGWHVFARSLPRLLARNRNAHVVIVGRQTGGYSPPRADGYSHFEHHWNEVKHDLDTCRVHVAGWLSRPSLTRLMQVSTAHVYLTYPFVLSWSMLEAMSMGALVVGSKTPPVEEVIEHGTNGFLVDFFDPGTLADSLNDILVKQRTHSDAYEDIRRSARQTILDRYDLKTRALPQQLRLIESL